MGRGTFIIIMMLIASSIFAQKGKTEIGYASFYADKFEGRTTANGEKYYHAKKTAAHKTLPFGTIVKVSNLENEKTVIVRINDRGPFVENRIIDLSKYAARKLDFINSGIVKVKVEIVGSVEGNAGNPPESTEDKVSWDYYQVDVKQIFDKGYSVQIASFKEYDNVLRLLEQLSKKYQEKVIVQVYQEKTASVYRVLIGHFPKEQEAQKLKAKIKKVYKDCFVVTLK